MKRLSFVMVIEEDEIPIISTVIELIMSGGLSHAKDFVYKMEEVDKNVRSENADNQS